LKEGDSISIGKQIMVFAEEPPAVLAKAPIPKSAAVTSVEQEEHPQIPLIKITPPDPSAVTVPDAAPVPPKEDKSSDGSSQSFNDFFGQNNTQNAGDIISNDNLFGKTKQDIGSEGKDQEKKHGGILFYVAVLAVTAILAAAFIYFQRLKDAKYKTGGNETTQTAKKEKGAPLLVRYEKEIATNGEKPNIFRYVLEIKDGKVTATRDDLQAHLKNKLPRNVSEDDLDELRQTLQDTDFMSLEQPQRGTPSPEEDRSQRLIIAYGKEMNDILVDNIPPPADFLDAITAIENFSADVLNIPTASLTPEEMRETGLAAFAQAKDLFDNYQAKDENLNEAIKRFSIAKENLQPFSPTPPEYEEACILHQKALKMLNEMVKTHFKNSKTYMRLKEYEKAKEEMLAVMGELDPGKKYYKLAKDKVISLEDAIRKQKRRKRK
jgi:hypothetical protein